ncbi:MAG: acyltransferase [Candidatus Eisenbacteria bacterium]|nr:acyltransferase [Candidatus Eisenbacteria bacterium]
MTHKQRAAGPWAAPTTRLTSLDFLRGVAALSVVAHHAINFGWGQNMPMHLGWFRALHAVVDRGDLGVPLFFVISGFCIHMRWARRFAETGVGDSDFAGFWKRRIHRLYPPYFFMLLISTALLLTAVWMGRQTPLVTRYPEPRLPWIAWDFVSHVFMLHGLHPLFDLGGGNPPFWTLAREEYFYALYFVLLAWRRPRGVGGAVMASLVLGILFPAAIAPLLMRVPGGAEWWTLVRTSAFSLWIQWTLGMLAVEGYFGLVKLPRICSAPWLVPVWAALALLAESRFPVAGPAPVPSLSPALWGMTFFTLLNYCVRLERGGRWPSGRVVAWLTRAGIFSYSLYLVHVPARAVMKQLLGPLAATHNPYLYLALAVALAVGGYFAGKAYFLAVESRFLNTRPSTATRKS